MAEEKKARRKSMSQMDKVKDVVNGDKKRSEVLVEFFVLLTNKSPSLVSVASKSKISQVRNMFFRFLKSRF